MNNISRFTAGLVLTSACLSAFAQTSPAVPASQPTAVGVTPETARAANEKAVPRSDVATVVRTGPTAADKVSSAKADMSAATTGTSSKDGMAVTTTAQAGNANRAPRVDRH